MKKKYIAPKIEEIRADLDYYCDTPLTSSQDLDSENRAKSSYLQDNDDTTNSWSNSSTSE